MVSYFLPIQETQEMQVQFLGQEDALEEEMATHCSVLAGITPWTEDLAGHSSWGHKSNTDLGSGVPAWAAASSTSG